MPFKGVFCWGTRDYDGYKKLFESKRSFFYNTGSPRVDLWRPELKRLWRRDYIEDIKPYILYISNNGFAVGKRHWTEYIGLARSYELLNSKEAEEAYYRNIQKDIFMVRSAVFSLRELAAKYRNVNFVIRPHPLDNESYWREAIGKHENIHVIYRDVLTPWIAGAKAIIHNSCSSALEAVIQDIPVISYVPAEICDALDIPNKLGIRANSHEALLVAVGQIVTGEADRYVLENSREILNPLLTSNKDLAALKIIELIESLTDLNHSIDIGNIIFTEISLALRAKSLIDKARGIYSRNAANLFNRRQVKEEIRTMSKILGIKEPKVRFVSNSTILVG
jgi:hypothetical protein